MHLLFPSDSRASLQGGNCKLHRNLQSARTHKGRRIDVDRGERWFEFPPRILLDNERERETLLASWLALGYQSRPPRPAPSCDECAMCVQAIWVKRRKSEVRSREISTRAPIRIEGSWFRVLAANARIENATRIESSFGNREKGRVFLEETKKEEGEMTEKGRRGFTRT